MTVAAKVDGLRIRLEKMFRNFIDRDYEVGLQFVLYLEGEPVIELCLGRVASQSGSKLEFDNIFPVCSTGKGITATLAHILAARGEVDLNLPISNYWTEYGVYGKERTTLAEALAHRAGIPQRGVFSSFAEACDWNAACAKIAGLVPKWTPGSTAEYHSLNWGWIVGGALERATGLSFGELLYREITGPLGIERELYFGTSPEAEARVSKFEPQPATQAQCMTASAVQTKVPGPLMDFVNRPDVRRACMPAVNGMMSARGIAKVYAALVSKVAGVRLLPDRSLREALTVQTPPGTFPPCFGHGMGLGYPLKGPKNDPGSFFGHGGAGGSEGMAVRPLNLAFGFTKNRFDTHADAPGHTLWLVVKEVFDTFGNDCDGGFYRQ